jgi:hypothetical protein
MKIVIGIAVVIVLVLSAGVAFMVMTQPKPKDFVYLEEPRIIEKPSVKAMHVSFNGKPDDVLSAAFKKLYGAYYSIKGVPKGPKQPASIARYNEFDEKLNLKDPEELKSVDWNGYIALPVPESVNSLPEKSSTGEYAVELKTLEYGKVAEIIHFGTYESELPTINKLKQFIEDQGFEISGLHEEEYIKGPGMLFVSPKDYITIIRYQVKKI